MKVEFIGYPVYTHHWKIAGVFILLEPFSWIIDGREYTAPAGLDWGISSPAIFRHEIPVSAVFNPAVILHDYMTRMRIKNRRWVDKAMYYGMLAEGTYIWLARKIYIGLYLFNFEWFKKPTSPQALRRKWRKSLEEIRRRRNE